MLKTHETELSLPFNGEWFVMNGGDTESVNHHNGNKAQNFALDFTVIDSAGHSFNGKGDKNEDYHIFGKPILSPADGLIIEAVDGVRDNNPGQGNYLAGAGNYIIIQHYPNEFSFIAHIMRGSLNVKAGDTIKTRQQLGLVGNSGVSFTPHLHYHLQDSVLLDQYTVNYTDLDLRKSFFPKLDIADYTAKGIKPYFNKVKLVGSAEAKALHSPVRGDLISST